jgi:diguanylate cyclase (GGDEF)-like protein/PAS domain S-box-containing protein
MLHMTDARNRGHGKQAVGVADDEQRREWLADMLDSLPERVCRFAVSDRRISYCNQAWALSHNSTPAELTGRCLDDLLSAGEREGLAAQLAKLDIETGTLADLVARPAPDGPDRWISWSDQLIPGVDGNDEILAVGRDVTDEHVAKLALVQSEERFRHLAEHSADLVWRFASRPEPHFTYLSPSIERFTGYTAEELVADFRLVANLLDDEEGRALLQTAFTGGPLPDRYDIQLRHRDGSLVIVEMQATRLADGSQGVGRDVTEIRALQVELSALALRDPLTGLANRRLLDELLTSALDRGRRSGSEIAVIFLDLDNFKNVNDTYGHDVGDRVLQVTADRLRSSVRASDAVARVGGDEFVVVHESSNASIGGLAHRIETTLAAAIDLGDHGLVRCHASVGFATTRTTAHDARALITAADAAMYTSKRQKARLRSAAAHA